MAEKYQGETRLYWALGMLTLPVVVIAATSVAAGGRSSAPGAPFGGLPLAVVIELAVLGPVFLAGIVVALRAIIGDSGRRH